MNDMVLVKAKRRGTFTHSTGNYHFDPDGFPAARERQVPRDVALGAKAKGLVEIPKVQMIVEGEEPTTVQEPRRFGRSSQNVDDVAAARSVGNGTGLGKEDAGSLLGSTAAADTMTSTHTQTDRTTTAGNADTGAVDVIDDDDADGDDDLAQDSDAPPLDDDKIEAMGSSRDRRAARRRAAEAG